MEYIFAAGFLLSLVLCIASLFTPRTVKFLKSPSKMKGILIWLFVSVLCFSGLGVTVPKVDKKPEAQQATTSPSQNVQPPQSMPSPAPVTALAESPPLDLSLAPTPDDEKEYVEARARIAKKTPPVQAELSKLYKELLAMRNTREFKELGFSTKNKKSTEWKSRVEAFAARIKKDDDLPVEVKAAPSYLIQLGMEKAWREGATTSDSKWNTQMVQDGINWKLEE